MVFNRYAIITNCNHKVLGLYYLWIASVFGFYGFILSVIIRTELYSASFRIIPQENVNFYNMVFTIHGIIMIFFNIMPGLMGAYGNYFLPILCGSPELAFPRLNSISLLLQPIAFALIVLSTAAEFSGGTGWTLYPPLSTSLMSISPVAIDVIISGLLVTGVASIMTSLNFITTVVHLRAKGLTLGMLSVSVWSLIVTSIMLLLTLPVLTGGVLMLLSDLHFNTLFYDPVFAGDPVLYQHLFWFFGHPEVYILILPAFGIISHVISSNFCRSLFGNQSMILAMCCIAVLGSLVWGHHMYTTGLEVDTRAFFTSITILISIPTGTKVFHWVCTYLNSNFGITHCSALLPLLFICTFTFGGTTGVILGNASIDIALHDTYFVVAHFHFVLSVGTIIALFTLASHFQEYFFGRHIRSNLVVTLWIMLFFIGVLLTFLPMHFLGFTVMPRRIPDYPDNLNGWNMICSLGSTMVLFGLLIFK
nr:cytochrome c oxidase subunit I [Leucocytozoon sp.]WMH04148.1 cytochrome c oxidase subunit I [Leucocytozoon sp.]